MAKTKAKKSKKLAVRQRGYKVGDKKPPHEYDFKPGQSGNPKGPPVHRTNLWLWYCKYMNMTNEEFSKLDRAELTQVQQSALKMVEDMKAGKYTPSSRMARYTVDREIGKPVETIFFGDENKMTDEECEEVRELLLKNHANR
jgi:hypothetical protein